MKGEELKPCPFCGAHLERSERLSTRSTNFYVHPVTEPDDCILNGVIITDKDDDRAAAWNRRAALEPQDAEPLSAVREAAYREGWNDREAELLAGVARIVPTSAPEPQGEASLNQGAGE
jgi:hypothetical protein